MAGGQEFDARRPPAIGLLVHAQVVLDRRAPRDRLRVRVRVKVRVRIQVCVTAGIKILARVGWCIVSELGSVLGLRLGFGLGGLGMG